MAAMAPILKIYFALLLNQKANDSKFGRKYLGDLHMKIAKIIPIRNPRWPLWASYCASSPEPKGQLTSEGISE